MANKEKSTYPKGFTKQTEEFAGRQTIMEDAYVFIKEYAVEAVEKAFEKAGVSAAEGVAGYFANGKAYGKGVSEDKYSVTIGGNTRGYLEKHVTYGANKTVIEIFMDVRKDTVALNYKMTELAFQKPYFIDEKFNISLKSFSKFKTELKKKFDKLAKKEVDFIMNMKLGAQDRTLKSVASVVSESGFSLENILSSDAEDVSKLFESSIHEDDIEMNHPDVVDANTPDNNLLFDDLAEIGDVEDLEEGDFKDHIKNSLVKFGLRNLDGLNDLSDMERKSFIKHLAIHNNLSEITSAGSAAASQVGGENVGNLGTAGPFKYASNPFERTPYFEAQKGKPKVKKTKKHGDAYFTSVELEPGTYQPKGMSRNYVMGQHGVKVNGKSEDKKSKQTRSSAPTKKARKGKALKENYDLDLTKRKFTNDQENQDKGINKRYIVTEQYSDDDLKNRWAKLIGHEAYETIRLAESVIPEEVTSQIISESVALVCECGECDSCSNKGMEFDDDMIGRDEYNSEFDQEFSDNNSDMVNVQRPGSVVVYRFMKEEYEDTNKAYLLDHISNNYIENPNYKPVTYKNRRDIQIQVKLSDRK